MRRDSNQNGCAAGAIVRGAVPERGPCRSAALRIGSGIGCELGLRMEAAPQRRDLHWCTNAKWSRKPATHCHAFETCGGRRRRNFSRPILNLDRGIGIGVKEKHRRKTVWQTPLPSAIVDRRFCTLCQTEVVSAVLLCPIEPLVCGGGICSAVGAVKRRIRTGIHSARGKVNVTHASRRFRGAR
jgi:hypothetical protein